MISLYYNRKIGRYMRQLIFVFSRVILWMFFVSIGVWLFPLQSYAADQEKDFYDMNLKELVKVKMSVASKRQEQPHEAPGIVNIITNEEILLYGGKSLYEVLSRLPDTFGIVSPALRDNSMGIRGQTSRIDNHTLLLIDNRPFRESYSGGINQQIYRAFPIDIIDRIEIIRGPGSVLYGSNAFAGVINIVTKKGKRDSGTKLSSSYGSDQTWQVNGANYSHSGDLSTTCGVKIYQSDGFKVKGFDSNGVYGQGKFGHKTNGVFIGGEYKDFTLTAFRAESNEDSFAPSTTWPIGKYDKDSTLINMGYKKQVNESLKIEFDAEYLGFNQDYIDKLILVDNDDLILDLMADWEISDKISMQFGYTFYRIDGEFVSYGSSANYEYDTNSSYVQLDYRLGQGSKIVIGVQLDKVEKVKSNYSPRVGIIHQFNDDWGTKLLFAKAFRAASAFEKFLNIPGVLVGDPNLLPEKIRTSEWQLFYRSKNNQSAITVFQSKITKIIDNDPITHIYTNQIHVDSEGVTLETKQQLPANIELMSSLSYQETDSKDRRNFFGAPKMLFKLGVSYKTENFDIGLFNSNIGKRYPHPSSIERNPKAKRYNLLTLNSNFYLKNIFPKLGLEDSVFSVYGYNLLNEKIHGIAVIGGITNTMPVDSGRSIHGTISFSF